MTWTRPGLSKYPAGTTSLIFMKQSAMPWSSETLLSRTCVPHHIKLKCTLTAFLVPVFLMSLHRYLRSWRWQENQSCCAAHGGEQLKALYLINTVNWALDKTKSISQIILFTSIHIFAFLYRYHDVTPLILNFHYYRLINLHTRGLHRFTWIQKPSGFGSKTLTSASEAGRSDISSLGCFYRMELRRPKLF